MPIEGQATARRRDSGYVMAALLVSLAVMSILMAVVLPSWRQMMQREREAELIWRGEQYARAVGLFQRKFAGSFAPSIDILVNQKFLRKKYKDPMVPGGEFQVLYQTSAARVPGVGGPGAGGSPVAGAPPGIGTPRPGISVGGEEDDSDRPVAGLGPGTATGTVGPRGGVIGVVSKSTKQGLRLYQGRSRYNEWQFLYTAVSTGAGATEGDSSEEGGPGGGPGGLGGGTRQPGGPGGLSRPGTMPPGGTGRPPFGTPPGRPGSIGVGRPTMPGGPPPP